MKISIIVPIYNSAKYLRRCLDTIINQTYKNIEIILVDDCSTDNSLELCMEYKNKDNRITIIKQMQNGGQVSAYIEALKIASGEYIGFVDSDDWIDLSMYEKLTNKIYQYSDIDMVVCGCKKVYDKDIVDEPKNFKIYDDLYNNTQIKSYSTNIFTSNNVISDFIKFYRCNKLIKKDVLINNLKYVDTDIRVFEDNCLILPTILDCKKICCVKEYLYFYFQRNNSTMYKFDSNVIETNRRVIKKINKIYNDREIKHDISFEVYMCVLFSLDMLLRSKESNKVKINLLKEIRKDIKNSNSIPMNYYNKKIKISLNLLRLGMYRLILICYLIHKFIKVWVDRNEK